MQIFEVDFGFGIEELAYLVETLVFMAFPMNWKEQRIWTFVSLEI